jgi:2-methylcitrate synthase/citrate synthase II
MAEQTKPAYSPGLDGIIAGESSICSVDRDAGLRYRGYDVEQLSSSATFEDVAWLILHGELPTASELTGFRKHLLADTPLPGGLVEIIRKFPRNMKPMYALATAICALASFDPDLGKTDAEANHRKSVRLLARVTSVVTAAWRIAHGQEPVASDESSLAGRFWHGLTGKKPEDWQVKVLDEIFILYAEHEFNASTFAARVTASTLADMYAAIVSAIGALEGPLHGGANEEAMKMLEEIGTVAAVEPWVKGMLAKKGKIMGFGHRVYKKGDSRVPVMRNLLKVVGPRVGNTKWLDVCVELERVMEKEKGLFANLDLYAAPVLKAMGLPAELNTPLFACSRVVGWCAHVTEQQGHNRIIRPRSLYTGPAPRDLKK